MTSTIRQVDEILNGFIYKLYALASDPDRNSSDQPIISDPVVVDAVLKAPDRFKKNFSLIGALGENRFSANGEEWRLRRELTQPSFARAGTSGNRGFVSDVYRDALQSCETTSAKAVQQALLTASTTVFFRALGIDAPVSRLLIFFDRARRVLKYLQYHSWVAPDDTEKENLRQDVITLLEDYEREMTRSPELQALVNRLYENGKTIPNFVATEELLMSFFAGIETTAAALGFAIDRLGVDKRVQERLLREVEAGDSCPYLECFINETMRYFPPIPFVVRQATEDGKIGGYDIKAGQLVVLSIVGVHHHAQYWKEPSVFDCSRAEFLQNSYDRRAFIPFMSGPRTCGGATLARIELTEGLKALIRQFKVNRNGDELRFDYGLALRPNTWELVSIERRVRPPS